MSVQSIDKPFGITTFGSAITRVEPDIASLHFSVSRLEQRPKDAFRQAREAANQVGKYLAQAGMKDVGTSRITLSQTTRYTNNEHRFVGYTAKITFHLILKDLDRIEEILIGVTDAGANEIDSVDYQTSRLKELRAEARQRAVVAAREKAEVYCQVAGLTLGPVIHIEDINPDQLRGREGHYSQNMQILTSPDEEGPVTAFNPGSILVSGAVMVAFEFGRV